MNKKKKIKILDCTIRDGGYYNNWQFSKEITKRYFKSVIDSGVDAIEIGFRFPPKNNFLGPFAYTTDSLVKNYKLKSKILAVMINGSDLLKNKNYYFRNTPLQKTTNINTIRIACHSNEIIKVSNICSSFKRKGYRVMLNLMQINLIELKTLERIIKKINKKNIEVLYFADSLGALNPQQTLRICKIFNKFWDKEYGIHSHDNCGLAIKNCRIALLNGATWFDGTIRGMGRGAGNISTENLFSLVNKFNIKKKNLKFYKLNKLKKTLNDFKKFHQIFKWGKSRAYEFAAKKNIHPTYVQYIQQRMQLDLKGTINILGQISSSSGRNFNLENLNQIMNRKNKKLYKGKWNATNFLKNKNVLLFANGNSISSYSEEIKEFIKIYKPVTLSLNYVKKINKKYIDYFLFSHHRNFLVYKEFIRQNLKKIILPAGQFFNDENHNFKIKDYGIKIEKNKMVIKKNYCVLENNLAFLYAISLSKIGKAKKVFLAGFDGNIENTEYLDMIKAIQVVKENLDIKISSLFATKYPLKVESIYTFI